MMSPIFQAPVPYIISVSLAPLRYEDLDMLSNRAIYRYASFWLFEHKYWIPKKIVAIGYSISP
jgi:hypothetical protein